MNLKYASLIFFIFFIVPKLDAQFQHQYGEIILTNGDTVRGEINVYKHNILITSIYSREIVIKGDSEKDKIDISDISSVMFESITYEKVVLPMTVAVMRQGKMTRVTKMITCLAAIEIDGRSQLLKHYYFQGYGPKERLTSDYYIRVDDKILEISKTIFKKTIAEIYPDCTILQEKVKNKEFRFDELEEVVRYANKNCYN